MGYITVYASVYLCCCAASFVVDLTFGIHFGMDYGTFNGLLVSELYLLFNTDKAGRQTSRRAAQREM